MGAFFGSRTPHTSVEIRAQDAKKQTAVVVPFYLPFLLSLKDLSTSALGGGSNQWLLFYVYTISSDRHLLLFE